MSSMAKRHLCCAFFIITFLIDNTGIASGTVFNLYSLWTLLHCFQTEKGVLQGAKVFLFCVPPVTAILITNNITFFTQFYANWFYAYSLNELDLKFHCCSSFMSMFSFSHWWLRTIRNSSQVSTVHFINAKVFRRLLTNIHTCHKIKHMEVVLY